MTYISSVDGWPLSALSSFKMLQRLADAPTLPVTPLVLWPLTLLPGAWSAVMDPYGKWGIGNRHDVDLWG